jgi:hypothetical protein
MIPTVGRIVHYQSVGGPPSGGEVLGAPRAAIITNIETEQIVGLCVFDPGGTRAVSSVPYSEEPQKGHWSWPPVVPE